MYSNYGRISLTEWCPEHVFILFSSHAKFHPFSAITEFSVVWSSCVRPAALGIGIRGEISYSQGHESMAAHLPL